jgi:hypothetical protein
VSSTTPSRAVPPAAPDTTPGTQSGAAQRRSARAFAVHFAEMLAAMAVGMVALHPLWMWGLHAVGAGWLMANPYTGALIMATDMTLAMSAWMKVRGSGWRPVVEMGAAMYLPFLVLFVPLALGLIGSGALMLWGHLLMLPAMAGVMLLRPHEHAHR